MIKHYGPLTIFCFKHKEVISNIGFTLHLFLFKALEFEISYSKHIYNFFYLGLGWTTRQDHAGPSVNISILGFHIEFKIYDSRHWNYKTDRYYLPGEEE